LVFHCIKPCKSVNIKTESKPVPMLKKGPCNEEAWEVEL